MYFYGPVKHFELPTDLIVLCTDAFLQFSLGSFDASY